LTYCDFETLEHTPLQRDPFEYFVVPDFIKADKFAAVIPAPARTRPPNSTFTASLKS
jgi:hypothetical protein